MGFLSIHQSLQLLLYESLWPIGCVDQRQKRRSFSKTTMAAPQEVSIVGTTICFIRTEHTVLLLFDWFDLPAGSAGGRALLPFNSLVKVRP